MFDVLAVFILFVYLLPLALLLVIGDAISWLFAKGISYAEKGLIALPPAMLEQVDFVAQSEHRTRSDLMREALRRYLDAFRRQNSMAALVPKDE